MLKSIPIVMNMSSTKISKKLYICLLIELPIAKVIQGVLNPKINLDETNGYKSENSFLKRTPY